MRTIFVAILAGIAFSACSNVAEEVSAVSDKEWLGVGEVIEVGDYKSNKSNSPAALSLVNSAKLNARQQQGQKIYSKWCMACHGEGMPGTNALAVAYKDAGIPALLEAREDLVPETVGLFVRFGKHSMPFFRKAEINDEELQMLGEYLEVAHKFVKR